MKSVFICISVLVSSLFLSAQQHRACSGGDGGDRMQIAGGYVAQVSGATDAAHGGQCHATITSSDGKVIYENYGNELALNAVSGNDINGDGKPDVVLESHPPARQCCWNYFVLTPGEEPVLTRQLTTSVPLNFEDKLGDGKTEIWARDFAFLGVDNFPLSESPEPLIFLRLRGKTLYDVSSLFWPDYEAEINEAKQGISNADIDDLTKIESEDAKPPDPHDPKVQRLQSVRALVLTVALDNLYGGHGPDCWKTISEMWPPLDRQRIRQLILQRRMRGILGEINKPATQNQ